MISQLSADIQKINASKIGHQYILIGKTNQEIGKLVTLEGKFLVRHQFNGLEFEVTKINDQKVPNVIYLRIERQSNKKYKTGIDYRISGNEVAKLNKIGLINQVDRSSVGRLGIDLSFKVDKVERIQP